ncbi:hypothetical protein EC991_011295 [Linnemannia zychae]|nr:hypothetical protein EC991_011295 [Linnemannia zychae]
MAAWAIEAEAAFMEVETIHHQHIIAANYTSNAQLTHPPASFDTLALDHQSTGHPPVDYDPIRKRPTPLSELRVTGTKPKEQPGQVFNDDLFEGDMLQAWMDTLALEKQEADEQEREQARAVSEVTEGKSDKQETTDQVVLEVALRRLNLLMHQLGHTQKSLAPSFARTDTSTNNRPKPATTIQGDAFFS